MKGIVSGMQHFSVGDGPGIRTTVFMQGCNLRCEWCHNPETISFKPVFLYYKNLCRNCGLCQKRCPQGAHLMMGRTHHFNRERCNLCGECIRYCPAGALKISGKETALSEVMEYILEDMEFYSSSNGGVTISGGEPLCQADFTAAIAKECKKHNIHVIVDTAGNVDFSSFEKVLSYTDCFFFDVKGTSERDYLSKTGGSLKLSLENMMRLISGGCNVVARIPVIPSYNDSENDCNIMAGLLNQVGVKQVHLLPFHRLGAGKYAALGKSYPYEQCVPPSKQQMQKLADIFAAHGFESRVDG